MEYLIDDKIIILNGKEYAPNFTDSIYYCFNSFNYQGVFNWSIVFNEMCDGFVYFKFQVDSKNKPKDYIFLEANDKYEEITCYRKNDIIGKKITEIEGIKKDCAQELIKKFYITAVNGRTQNFNLSSKLTGKNYSVFAYSPLKNFFALIFKEKCDTTNTRNKYRNDYKKVTDTLNKVRNSQAIITKLENPFKINKTRKLGIISSEIAKYLGIIDKNIKLKKSILISGLNKIIFSSDKKIPFERMESIELNTLNKYEIPYKNIRKTDIYFMIHDEY